MEGGIEGGREGWREGRMGGRIGGGQKAESLIDDKLKTILKSVFSRNLGRGNR